MTREKFIYNLPTLNQIRRQAHASAETPKEVDAFFIGAVMHLTTVAVRFHPGVKNLHEIYPDDGERCDLFKEFRKEPGYEGMASYYVKGERWFKEEVRNLLNGSGVSHFYG